MNACQKQARYNAFLNGDFKHLTNLTYTNVDHEDHDLNKFNDHDHDEGSKNLNVLLPKWDHDHDRIRFKNLPAHITRKADGTYESRYLNKYPKDSIPWQVHNDPLLLTGQAWGIWPQVLTSRISALGMDVVKASLLSVVHASDVKNKAAYAVRTMDNGGPRMEYAQ